MPKQKWASFNPFKDGQDDNPLTQEGSGSPRHASNPLLPFRPSLPEAGRRAFSENKYLDRPYSAKDLQKLHESQERSLPKSSDAESDVKEPVTPGEDSLSQTLPASRQVSQTLHSEKEGVVETQGESLLQRINRQLNQTPQIVLQENPIKDSSNRKDSINPGKDVVSPTLDIISEPGQTRIPGTPSIITDGIGDLLKLHIEEELIQARQTHDRTFPNPLPASARQNLGTVSPNPQHTFKVDAIADHQRPNVDSRVPTQASVGSSPLFATGSDDMASVPFRTSGDGRRPNRYENRPPIHAALCRNGPQCRKHQEGTCGYNHDFTSMAPNGLNALKKSLNVDSPTFTPKSPNVQPAKVGISPKAAAAAAFTPRGSGTATPAATSHSKEPSVDFIPPQMFQATQQYQEFVPGQSFLASPQADPQPQLHQQLSTFGDPFLTQQTLSGLEGSQAQINPYAQATTAVGGQPFFQDASSFKHPLNYHLYSSIGPRRDNLMAYQRNTADFFIPDDLREELQRKSEATLQTFANSTLPQTVEHFHSLVALDTNNSKGPSTFGYPSWIYKATSHKDGHTYALRRIEGFRLTSEASIRTVNSWKRISNGSMVRVHDAFTGRWFGDSSLIIVTDYHPRSQTLAEKHFSMGRQPHRPVGQVTPESDLWGYIVQLSSALKAIHEAGVAAQTVMPSKVLVTSKNRLRLNACGIFDIIQHEQRRPVSELQQADLQDLGRLILGIAARNPTAHQNTPKALELVSRSYSERLRSCIAWLVVPPHLQQELSPAETPAQSTEYNVHTLLNNIADKVIATFDSTLHLEDELTSNLMRELENGRLVRLLTKLNVVLERPDTSSTPSATSNPALLNQASAAWSETGERYYLKLFRDYVFHQVDHDGRPVLDLGHIITCLNKLDAGIDENIQLISRDEQSVFIVTYKEVKRGFESAWAEISKASSAARR